MDWTQEAEERLRTRWREGASAKEIANEIGGVTRSAVIGKIHRMGEAKREKGHKRGPKREPRAPRLLRKRTQMEIIFGIPPVIEPPPRQAEFLNVDIFDLRDGACRFPRGDNAPYLFCGQPAREGSVYCDYCHAITHTVATRIKAPRESDAGTNLGLRAGIDDEAAA